MHDLPKLGSPALRALTQAGVLKLEHLTTFSEAAIAALHGMGPKALKMLRTALHAQGLSFAEGSEVDAYMRTLEHPLKAEVEAVRAIMLAASPKIEERIKWNAPSYHYKEDMAAFNLHQQEFVQLIVLFPKGLVGDMSLLQGKWDSRREIRLANLAEVRAKAAALTKLVQDWMRLMDAA